MSVFCKENIPPLRAQDQSNISAFGAVTAAVSLPVGEGVGPDTSDRQVSITSGVAASVPKPLVQSIQRPFTQVSIIINFDR